MIFSWQHSIWQRLQRAKTDHRLAHALLFSGVGGIGKTHFAEEFACSLLCEQPNISGYACGVCHACCLTISGSHPNVLKIQPEKIGQAIKVDQIREAVDFMNQTALKMGYKILMIQPADAMNINAANALLKTLEEPPVDSLFLLVSDQAKSLPATIISRCQHVHFPIPSRDEAIDWLKKEAKSWEVDINLLLELTQGAPLAAISFLKNDFLSARKILFDQLPAFAEKKADPIAVAAQLKDVDLKFFIEINLQWLLDLLRLSVGMSKSAIFNKDYEIALSQMKSIFSLKWQLKFLNELQKIYAQINVGLNLNKLLLIESILIRWMGLKNVSS